MLALKFILFVAVIVWFAAALVKMNKLDRKAVFVDNGKQLPCKRFFVEVFLRPFKAVK